MHHMWKKNTGTTEINPFMVMFCDNEIDTMKR